MSEPLCVGCERAAVGEDRIDQKHVRSCDRYDPFYDASDAELATLLPLRPASPAIDVIAPRRGGRLPDPGLGTVCARCGEPRLAHGGRSHLGACPGQAGLYARRFRIMAEDREK